MQSELGGNRQLFLWADEGLPVVHAPAAVIREAVELLATVSSDLQPTEGTLVLTATRSPLFSDEPTAIDVRLRVHAPGCDDPVIAAVEAVVAEFAVTRQLGFQFISGPRSTDIVLSFPVSPSPGEGLGLRRASTSPRRAERAFAG